MAEHAMGNLLIGIIFTVALIVVVYLMVYRVSEDEQEESESVR